MSHRICKKSETLIRTENWIIFEVADKKNAVDHLFEGKPDGFV